MVKGQIVKKGVRGAIKQAGGKAKLGAGAVLAERRLMSLTIRTSRLLKVLLLAVLLVAGLVLSQEGSLGLCLLMVNELCLLI